MGAQNSNGFFPFNSNSLEKNSIRSKNNVPLKCLLPLFWASEREEQEGIRFGGAGMQINYNFASRFGLQQNCIDEI